MAASESNAQSTAFAIQGLVAAGRNPRAIKRTRTPIEYLKSLQAADGSIRYSRTSTQTPVWVTAQALNALESKPFPLRPEPRQKARSVKTAAAASTPAPAPAPAKTARTHRRQAKVKARPRAHAAVTATGSAESEDAQLGTSEAEIQTRPVAQTTTTTAATGQEDDGEAGWWPLAFAVLLGIVVLVGLRVAWRRG
jgi:hypothetical protein